MALASAIYRGKVRHRRFVTRTSSRANSFSYKLYMMYLDLSELDEVFAKSRCYSLQRFAFAWLKREDYIGDSNKSIYQSVCEYIQEQTGDSYNGKVRLLTHLRYFGYSINPISNYYCFDESGEQLLYIIAAVTNTPWNETHYYLHSVNGEKNFRCVFDKNHHVSPFMPMTQQYHWRSNTPGDILAVHLENHQQGEKVFDATLSLKREEISSKSLHKILVYFPLMTVKVVTAIYYQALKLWLKGIRFQSHPNKKVNLRNAKKDKSIKEIQGIKNENRQHC